MMTRLIILLALLCAGPAASFEFKDRATYILPDLGGLLAQIGQPPLPVMLQDQRSLLRVTFTGAWLDAEVVWVETFPDQRPAVLHRQTVLGSNGQGQPRPGKITSRPLTAAELSSVSKAFDAIKLCSARPDRLLGLDGFSFDFEFANATRYCAVSRFAPDDTSPFYALGRLLFGLTAPGE